MSLILQHHITLGEHTKGILAEVDKNAHYSEMWNEVLLLAASFWPLGDFHSKCLGLIFVTCVLCFKVYSWLLNNMRLKCMVPLTCWYFSIKQELQYYAIRGWLQNCETWIWKAGSQLFLDFPLCIGRVVPLNPEWEWKRGQDNAKNPTPNQVALFKMRNKFHRSPS